MLTRNLPRGPSVRAGVRANWVVPARVSLRVKVMDQPVRSAGGVIWKSSWTSSPRKKLRALVTDMVGLPVRDLLVARAAGNARVVFRPAASVGRVADAPS